MEKESKPKRKIGFMQAGFMIGVAVLFDLAQAGIELISVGFLGWLLNPLVSILASMTFFMWFTLSGVSFIKPGKLIAMGGTTLVELIPWINDIPAWTFGVIITLAMIYAEDIVALISPAAAAALALALSKINGKGLSKKGVTGGKQEDHLSRLNSKKNLDSNDKEKLTEARLIMEHGHIRSGETDPVLLAAYERYKKGEKVYNNAHTVDEKGNFQRDEGFNFANVQHLGGGQVKTINSAESKAKQEQMIAYRQRNNK